MRVSFEKAHLQACPARLSGSAHLACIRSGNLVAAEATARPGFTPVLISIATAGAPSSLHRSSSVGHALNTCMEVSG